MFKRMQIGGDDRCGKCGKSEAFFCGAFSKHPMEIIKQEVGRRPTFVDFHRCDIFHSGRARRVFEICGKEISGHAASATNKRHLLLRRLGMDFRAETTRFGPTSHTQMSSELTTQDSTIGPAQDQSQVEVYLKGRNYFGM